MYIVLSYLEYWYLMSFKTIFQLKRDVQPHRQCNDKGDPIKCGRSWVQAPIELNIMQH